MSQPVRFVPDFFDYRSLHLPAEIPANTGYAGFKVLNQLNTPGKWDELGAFQGASYFRLLGQGQVYGMSARGLALDCGEDGRPEEFPIFTDWWLGKPQQDDDVLLLYAILDSVSCTGAYEFLIHPGATTVAEVEAVLYFRERANILAADPQRKPLATIGFAPLTSMYWFGSASERKFDDYRPEVHDSDGLLLHLGQRGNGVASAGQRGGLAPPDFPGEQRHGLRAVAARPQFQLITRTCFTPTKRSPASGWRRTAIGATARCTGRVEHAIRGPGQHGGVLESGGQARAAAAAAFRLHPLLDAGNRHAAVSNEVVSTRVGLNPRDAGPAAICN